MKELNEINGFYGSSHILCTIFTYNSNGGTWYAIEGSTNINFTHDFMCEGVDVEQLTDDDYITAESPVNSYDDLYNEVEL